MPRHTIHTLDNTDEPRSWYEDLPFITKWWFGTTLFVTCAANFGYIPGDWLLWDWDSVRNHFEVWRFLTPFVFAGWFGPDCMALLTLYRIVAFGQRGELAPYNTGAGGNTADFAFALLFGAASIILTYPLMGMIGMPSSPLLSQSMVFFVIYAWSKRQPNATVHFWFATMVVLKAIQLPFAHVLLNIALGQSISSLLHGIAIGHLYYVMVDVVPPVYGKDFLHAPRFLIDLLRGRGRQATGSYTMHRPLSRASTDKPCRAEAHSWGGGQALGSY